MIKTEGEGLHPVVIELLGEGRKLADRLARPLCAVLVGEHEASMPVPAQSAAAVFNGRIYKSSGNDGTGKSALCSAVRRNG